MASKDDTFLTPEEVHDYTGVAVQTLANWRTLDAEPTEPTHRPKRGPVAVKMLGDIGVPGGRVGYWKSDVDAWLKERGMSAADMRRYLQARRERRAVV